MIAMIGPRLTDPKTKTNEFLELFRFAEEKSRVEEILKARANTISSTAFKQNTLAGRGGGRGRGGAGRGTGLSFVSRATVPKTVDANLSVVTDDDISSKMEPRADLQLHFNAVDTSVQPTTACGISKTASSDSELDDDDDISVVSEAPSAPLVVDVADSNKTAGVIEELTKDEEKKDDPGEEEVHSSLQGILNRPKRAITFSEKPKHSVLSLAQGGALHRNGTLKTAPSSNNLKGPKGSPIGGRVPPRNLSIGELSNSPLGNPMSRSHSRSDFSQNSGTSNKNRGHSDSPVSAKRETLDTVLDGEAAPNVEDDDTDISSPAPYLSATTEGRHSTGHSFKSNHHDGIVLSIADILYLLSC